MINSLFYQLFLYYFKVRKVRQKSEIERIKKLSCARLVLTSPRKLTECANHYALFNIYYDDLIFPTVVPIVVRVFIRVRNAHTPFCSLLQQKLEISTG